MKLKEAIRECKWIVRNFEDMRKYELPPHKMIINSSTADCIDTVLQALENSIPKQVIEYTLEQIRIGYFSRLEKCKNIEEKNIVTAQYNSMRGILEDILEEK